MLSHTERKCLTERVRRDYEAGHTIWDLTTFYPQLSKGEIRAAVDDILRKKRAIREEELSEAEVAQRVAEIRASWSPEVARSRWVGGSRDSRELLERAASRLLPD
jgi:hypothetical protein